MKVRTTRAAAALALTTALLTPVAAPQASTSAPARPAGPTTLAAPDVSLANIQAHLSQFQTIATQNGGNRRAGSAGHTASVAYVKAKLQAAGYTVTEQYCSTGTYRSNNVIAEWPAGPTDQVVMFGAHLDGVSAGPGINDNASGSAVPLEIVIPRVHDDAMAAPAPAHDHDQPRAVPLREARTRLTQLVAMAELTDTVTVITRDGDSRPVAAIVPAAAARTVAQARADAQRVASVSAGWARRLDDLHEQGARRHAAELRAVTTALAEVWAELAQRVPPGSDPALDRLRAAHADLLRG